MILTELILCSKVIELKFQLLGPVVIFDVNWIVELKIFFKFTIHSKFQNDHEKTTYIGLSIERNKIWYLLHDFVYPLQSFCSWGVQFDLISCDTGWTVPNRMSRSVTPTLTPPPTCTLLTLPTLSKQGSKIKNGDTMSVVLTQYIKQ